MWFACAKAGDIGTVTHIAKWRTSRLGRPWPPLDIHLERTDLRSGKRVIYSLLSLKRVSKCALGVQAKGQPEYSPCGSEVVWYWRMMFSCRQEISEHDPKNNTRYLFCQVLSVPLSVLRRIRITLCCTVWNGWHSHMKWKREEVPLCCIL